MSDNGDKLILPKEEQPQERQLLMVSLTPEGQLKINIADGAEERLLILMDYYVTQAIRGTILRLQLKAQQTQMTQAAEAQAIMNRLRGK